MCDLIQVFVFLFSECWLRLELSSLNCKGRRSMLKHSGAKRLGARGGLVVAHWPSIRKVAGSVPLVVMRFPRPGARGTAPCRVGHGSRSLVGSAVPQVTERGIGLVGHASSLNDHSDNMPVSVGFCGSVGARSLNLSLF